MYTEYRLVVSIINVAVFKAGKYQGASHMAKDGQDDG
jgi:hypothetical protein